MTPEQARYLWLAEYVADKPCKRGHWTLRSTRMSACKECATENRKRSYQERPWFVTQSKLKRAMPPWVEVDEIRPFYEESKRRTEETGLIHEVDHIIPLNGQYVCGLHVPWNLRVVTKTENFEKLAKHESDRNFDPVWEQLELCAA